MIQVVGYTECDGCKDVLDIDQDGSSVSTKNGANFIVTELYDNCHAFEHAHRL